MRVTLPHPRVDGPAWWLLAVALTLAALLAVGLSALLAADAADAKIKQLIKQLGSTDFGEREAATKELAKIGQPALEALRNAANTGDVETRRRAKELLEPLETALKLEPLLKQFASEKKADQNAAVKELAELGEPAREALRKIAKEHKDPAVRERAEAFVKGTDPEGIAALIKRLGHDDYKIRQKAHEEMLEIGWPALPTLREASRSADDLEVACRLRVIISTLEKR